MEPTRDNEADRSDTSRAPAPRCSAPHRAARASDKAWHSRDIAGFLRREAIFPQVRCRFPTPTARISPTRAHSCSSRALATRSPAHAPLRWPPTRSTSYPRLKIYLERGQPNIAARQKRRIGFVHLHRFLQLLASAHRIFLLDVNQPDQQQPEIFRGWAFLDGEFQHVLRALNGPKIVLQLVRFDPKTLIRYA